MPDLTVIDGRTPEGRFAPGHSGNPLGAGIHIVKRRVTKALEAKLKDPDCQEIAEALLAGMKSPDELPVAARIAFARVWPEIAKHELSGPDGGPVAVSSAQLWADVAEAARSEVPDVETVALPESLPSDEPGAD